MSLDTELTEALSRDGGRLFLVGGRVRDEVLAELGRAQPEVPDRDYLVTGLELADVIERLSRLGRAEVVGASFGVIKFTRDGRTVDIALPRRERSTGSHHRDFAVEAGPQISLVEDLARRDFRINMMARELRSGQLIDPYGGRDDLIARRLDIVRAETFAEDPLRILRGAQFAARFELTPSPEALQGMRGAAHMIGTVAAERMADELRKLLERSPRPSIGFELLRETGALDRVLPELMEGWDVEQNEFHAFSVYYHSLRACDLAPQELVLRLAALFHDVGKPRTKEGPHFYRHEFVGAEMAKTALQRLRFSNDVVAAVCRLVALHMYHADDHLSDAAIRRFIRRAGSEHIDALFSLRQADVLASGLPPRGVEQNARFEERVKGVLNAPHVFSLADLCIDGNDVIELMREDKIVGADFRGGPRVGETLRYCLEQTLDDPAKNQPHVLRELARQFLRGR